MLAGALLLITDLWSLLLEVIVGGSENFSEFAVTTSWTVLSSMSLLGGLLLLVALVGLYARQSEAAGTLQRCAIRLSPCSGVRAIIMLGQSGISVCPVGYPL